ncbi:GLPGLI family protein [Sediminibacterium sp.]|uniref:GLPGLI family protein n=1 Tax=Sediminibacterium sp. TaxID=1917865 RepID=UPI002735B8EF|nr:GLPGLI family protein [Sediminibacterium sp.]MDP3392602.1 GLPGLI family protein [Sediminibacterium sp.]MDP3566155.1 GLPGLI family protein [Sediminibacterium sp.]
MKYLITIFLLIIIVSLNGQNTKPPISGKAIYTFKHLRDTSLPNSIYTEKMLLMFNNFSYKYSSYISYVDDSISKSRTSNVLDYSKNSTQTKYTRRTIEELFYFFDKNEYYFVHPWIGDKVVIENRIDKIDWKILDSTKEVKGLNCALAEAKFKGRIYKAWFCPAISVNAGPWKLNGLPGLIIEAYDLSNSIQFSLESLEKNEQLIELPKAFKKVTKKEFDQLINSIKQNPSGFINAALNGSNTQNGSTAMQLNKSGSNTQNKKNQINNPIELNE